MLPEPETMYAEQNAFLRDLHAEREKRAQDKRSVFTFQGRYAVHVVERPGQQIGTQIWKEGTNALAEVVLPLLLLQQNTETSGIKTVAEDNYKQVPPNSSFADPDALGTPASRCNPTGEANGAGARGSGFRTNKRRTVVLELGCGTGTLGLILAQQTHGHVDHIYLTDHPKVLSITETNLKANHDHSPIEHGAGKRQVAISVRRLDWCCLDNVDARNLAKEICVDAHEARESQSDADHEERKTHDDFGSDKGSCSPFTSDFFIVGSECVYDRNLVEPLLRTICVLLEQLGVSMKRASSAGGDLTVRENMHLQKRPRFRIFLSFGRSRPDAEDKFRASARDFGFRVVDTKGDNEIDGGYPKVVELVGDET
ncbi:unnamed protein product [Amoebophrya sp. A120]|nr:unnamed protein product [Amoebophrya sp. A120]|eukprot:GSA120T00018945001.1